MLKYSIPKEERIHLIRIYFHLAVLPRMPTHITATVSDGLHVLTRSKKKLTIEEVHGKTKTYLAGPRALDSLAKLIATAEIFLSSI